MDQADFKNRWDEVMAKLTKEREELELKMNLGKKEAKAEWEKLEAKWRELKTTKMPPMKEAAKDTAGNVGAALHVAADELKKGYERMRKLL
jgi:hypothetical protein